MNSIMLTAQKSLAPIKQIYSFTVPVHIHVNASTEAEARELATKAVSMKLETVPGFEHANPNIYSHGWLLGMEILDPNDR